MRRNFIDFVIIWFYHLILIWRKSNTGWIWISRRSSLLGDVNQWLMILCNLYLYEYLLGSLYIGKLLEEVHIIMYLIIYRSNSLAVCSCLVLKSRQKNRCSMISSNLLIRLKSGFYNFVVFPWNLYFLHVSICPYIFCLF